MGNNSLKPQDMARSPRIANNDNKIEVDYQKRLAAGRNSVFDTRGPPAESPSPRGLYEVKYSPERMSLLERVKEKRKQRVMFRTQRPIRVDASYDNVAFNEMPSILPKVKL